MPTSSDAFVVRLGRLVCKSNKCLSGLQENVRTVKLFDLQLSLPQQRLLCRAFGKATGGSRQAELMSD